MVHIETENLILEEIKVKDASFIYELLNSPFWIQFIGDKNVQSEEEAKLYIKKNYLPQKDKSGIGNLVVRLKETGTPIGTCGFFKREELDHPDIGFAFLPKFMKKGYGFEAASALLNFAKNKLNINTVLGFTIPENIASIKLLEKLGLHQTGFFTFKNDTEKLLLFSTNK